MKETFKERVFRPEAEARIELCNEIIDNYLGQGLRLTLRQLYYQLVSKNAIPNEERSYKNLGNLISEARLAGLVDWNAIEDRVRQPRIPSEWSSPADLMESALEAYRLPRWEGQEYYIELWVEKDALAGVLRPLASKFHVTMMVNRGYSSQSAMYESANRYLSSKRTPILFYLGDHDPSGEDMVRDVRDRLRMFGVHEIEVYKLALTMDQIEKYDPPPNPAKVTDSRAAAYIAKHGEHSWEVDALPPNVLSQLIGKAFKEYIDQDQMGEIIEKENEHRKALKKAAEKLS